jgi:uncharacterized protein YndB with AHSA1/START domain
MNPSDSASLRVSRHLASAADRAFDAWLDPAVARRWLFLTPNGEIVRCDIDARTGGAFVIADRRDGEDVEHVGHYVEIDRPRRLAFTFGVPKYSSEVTTVVVTMTGSAEGCDVVLEHYDVPAEWRDQTEQGWRDLLARLDEVAGDEQA